MTNNINKEKYNISMKLKFLFIFILAIALLSSATMATDKVEAKEKVINHLVKSMELKAEFVLCKQNNESECNKISKKSKNKINTAKRIAKRNKINFNKMLKIAKQRYEDSLAPEPKPEPKKKKKASLKFTSRDYDDFTTFSIKTYKMDNVDTTFEDGKGTLIASGSKTKQRRFDNEDTIIKGIRFDCQEKTCRVSFRLEKDGTFKFTETSDFKTIDLYIGNRWLTMDTSTDYIFV